MKLTWDVTNRCNLKCKYCGAASLINEKKEQNTDWKKLIDYIKPFVKNITLLGGEPLLHPDIDKIIEYISLKGMHVSITTNGQVDKDVLKNIMKYNVDLIYVSIEGFKDSHDKIRGTGTWEKAIETVKYLKELNKNRLNKADIGISMVVNKLNKDEIVKFIHSTRDYGIIYQITPLLLMGNALEYKEMLEIKADELLKVFEEITEYSLNHPEVKINIANHYPIVNEYLNKKYGSNYSIDEVSCDAASSSIYADPYGNIYPCHTCKTVKINLNEKNNWNEDINEFKPFMQEVHNNGVNHLCEEICKYSDMCIPCPINKSAKTPNICKEAMKNLKDISLPLDAKFKLKKPYIIVESEEDYQVFYPNINTRTEYSVEGVNILKSISEFKTLKDISEEVSIEPEIIYKFLQQEKSSLKVIEKR